MKLSNGTETENIKLKDFSVGKGDSEKELKDEDVTEKKTESSWEYTTEEAEWRTLDTGIEEGSRKENKEEEEDPEEYVINKSRNHHYVRYGEILYRFCWYGFKPDE